MPVAGERSLDVARVRRKSSHPGAGVSRRFRASSVGATDILSAASAPFMHIIVVDNTSGVTTLASDGGSSQESREALRRS